MNDLRVEADRWLNRDLKKAGRERTLVPPESFRKYFWDADWKDVTRHAALYEGFIVCRIADKGNEEALRWLLGRVSAGRIAEAVEKFRAVSRKSKMFRENVWRGNVKKPSGGLWHR
jgi:hypothetical protein